MSSRRGVKSKKIATTATETPVVIVPPPVVEAVTVASPAPAPAPAPAPPRHLLGGAYAVPNSLSSAQSRGDSCHGLSRTNRLVVLSQYHDAR